MALRYSKLTTFAQVQDRLANEFVELYTEKGKVIISNKISHVQNLVRKHAETMPHEEEITDEP